ncbi:DMT family transporter [Skermania sp. ID1734]|uniref:DMT family transporter n=1 Tax=Skermania sp. ID1734 TaxID=2597516 RepID=UPI00117F6908|nr:DMT family transporter [Skermania sp. ID1734]TSE00770.1 DMT family transporter [Skermania sp. ID1734]
MNRHVVGLAAALAIGFAVAVQARINGELGARLNDGIAAALISFGVGLVLLCAGLSVSPRMRAGLRQVRAALARTQLRPWHLSGGLFGAFLVACQGITVSTIGVAEFTVAVVGGQILSSLLVDRAGIGPAGAEPLTVTRVVGAALGLGAVVLTSAGQLALDSGDLVLALLPALAGMGLAWQQAVNGRVATAGGPAVASWVNFSAGTIMLVCVFAIAGAVRGWPRQLPTQAWLYVGGVLGLVFIAIAAVVVRWIGVLLLGLASVAGQLIGAVVLDIVTPVGHHLTWVPVAGVVVVLGGVVVAALPAAVRRRA